MKICREVIAALLRGAAFGLTVMVLAEGSLGLGMVRLDAAVLVGGRMVLAVVRQTSGFRGGDSERRRGQPE